MTEKQIKDGNNIIVDIECLRDLIIRLEHPDAQVNLRSVGAACGDRVVREEVLMRFKAPIIEEIKALMAEKEKSFEAL